MKAATPQAMKRFAWDGLSLRHYFKQPGDGRKAPTISATTLAWACVMGYVLRENSYYGVECLVKSRARRALGLRRGFGDDALAYFTERLDPEPTRAALASAVRQAKRNKAYAATRFIGLAFDGTGAGRRYGAPCRWCHPFRNTEKEIAGYRHALSMAMVVGPGLTPLPVDVEPYGPGDCEYNASRRLLCRVVEHLGKRFAQYAVADGEYATAPFLHDVGEMGLYAVARLKENLPELLKAAQARFTNHPAQQVLPVGGERVELWDADDFDPWDGLRWQQVRVFRYVQHKKDGTVCEAYWLTDFPSFMASTKELYFLAKSRWQIENQGFNDGKNRYGLEHIPHHHENSLLIHWLFTILALVIEHLYRARYLHRGTHALLTPIEFLRLLRLNLALPTNSGFG